MAPRFFITRPQPSADQMADKLIQKGVDVFVCPLKHIHPIPVPQTLFEGVAGVILTSQHAVQGLTDCRRDMPLYVIGEESARQLSLHGFEQVHVCGKTAVSISDYLNKRNLIGNFLYLSGDIISYNLGARVHAGCRIRRHIAYSALARTALPDECLSFLKTVVHMFVPVFSPDTGAVLRKILHHHHMISILQKATLIAFSENIASSLQDLPWYKCHTLPAPTMEDFWAFADNALLSYNQEK